MFSCTQSVLFVSFTLLFADDHVIIADTEDNLQKAAHKVNQIITEYGLTMPVQKNNIDGI